MTKTRKVELLYKKAKGQGSDATPEEQRELRKYRVDFNESSFCATKANITAYVTAIDSGATSQTFYDWCMNNHKADRRRKGSGVEEMKEHNKEQNLSVMFIGWLVWGVALYWICNGLLSVSVCAVAGAIISVLLFRVSRKNAAITMLVLPALLATIFGMKNL